MSWWKVVLKWVGLTLGRAAVEEAEKRLPKNDSTLDRP